ncbi:MAG: hypothetical protein NZ455_16100 [Bacteroidia bacterium]|nr:hypothetical protein [Bacteroidia bacterium]MDW8348283.1 hypothetical protein [Bacteroidia bacterium]
MTTEDSIKIVKSFEELPPHFQKLARIDVRSVPSRWYVFLRGEEKHSAQPDYAHVLASHLLHRIVLWYMPVQMVDGTWEYRDTPMLTNYQYYQYAFCVGYKPIERAFKKLSEKGIIMTMDAGMLNNKKHYWVHLNIAKVVEITEKIQAKWNKISAKLGIGKKKKSYSDANKNKLLPKPPKKDKEKDPTTHEEQKKLTSQNITEQDKASNKKSKKQGVPTTTDTEKGTVIKKVVKAKKK